MNCNNCLCTNDLPERLVGSIFFGTGNPSEDYNILIHHPQGYKLRYNVISEPDGAITLVVDDMLRECLLAAYKCGYKVEFYQGTNLVALSDSNGTEASCLYLNFYPYCDQEETQYELIYQSKEQKDCCIC